MQPATESGDVFSLAATLYALLAGSPPRTVDSAPSSLEQMVEVANRPISPIPGVSRSLMDVLLAALDDDPAARPTAATFFGQLAKVPLRTSTRRPVAAAARYRPRRSRLRHSRSSAASAAAVHRTSKLRPGGDRRRTTIARRRRSASWPWPRPW